MLTKRLADHLEDVPEIDEGWWASVLADENHHSSQSKTAPVHGTAAAQKPTDWDLVEDLYNNDEVVTMSVYGCNRGGLLVEGSDFQGFVPISHLVDMPTAASEEDRRKILSDYVGQELRLKVIECEPDQERIVLSERAALAGEGRRRQLFNTLKPGEVVHGLVTNVTDFGAFIDLGGLEGLIHVSELSWGRVQHPADIVRIGKRVDALVLMVSEDSGRVALSLKRLCANPWDVLVSSYSPGDVVEAEVTTIKRFGAFARLKEGVEGLIHVSTIQAVTNSRNAIEDLLQAGQIVQVRILHIDAERRRLGLGLVALE